MTGATGRAVMAASGAGGGCAAGSRGGRVNSAVSVRVAAPSPQRGPVGLGHHAEEPVSLAVRHRQRFFDLQYLKRVRQSTISVVSPT